MPLGILTPDQMIQEKNHLGIIKSNDSKVIDITRGRGPVKEVPSVLREIIAEEVITNGNDDQVARSFGVSRSSVSAYKNGATSTTTYHEPDKQLNDRNNEVRQTIVDSARSKLILAIEEITPEKLAAVKVKDAAGIAKDMSAVVRNLEPSINLNQQNTQVIVYRPQMKNESDFDVIQVNE